MTTLMVSTVLALTGCSLWYIFRRTAPEWTTEDLPSDAPDNVEVVSKLTEEERIAVKTAFLPGNDFRWMVGGKTYETDLDEKDHVKATFYMLECVLTFAERYGHILVSRDEMGKFLGALALIPPYKYPSLSMLHLYRSAIPLGMPVPMQMGKGVSARFDAFTHSTAVKHKQLMKGIPHWYVQLLGVSPDAQGKGVGRQLMNAAIAIAGQTPLYLECHDGNVVFYKKCGFTPAKRFWLVPKGIEDTTSFPYNSMVYGV